MRGVALLGLLLMAACSSIAPNPTASAPRTSAAAPTPLDGGATPTPAGGATLALPAPWAVPAVPAGECALPLYWPAPGLDGYWQGGFLAYPSGTMYASGLYPPSKAAGAFGGASATYDRAAGRWLPVAAGAISPDGLSFAYADYDLPPSPQAGMAGERSPHMAGALATTGRVHLVDARTGADRILFEGSPTYQLAGFTSGGIYLAQVLLTMDGELASGLYRMSTAGGAPVAVAGAGRQLDRAGWSLGGGAAWGVDFSAGGGITGGNRLLRLDLVTGAVQVWLTEPEGTAVSFLGVDAAGRALAAAFPNGDSTSGSPAPAAPTQLLSISAPGAGKVVYSDSVTSAPPPAAPTAGDSHGVWMSGLMSAVWLVGASGVGTVAVPVRAVIGVGGACV